MPEKRGHIGGHRGIEIRGTAHHTNIGQLRLRLTRDMGKDALAQLRCRLLHLKNLHLCYARSREYRRPAALRLNLLCTKAGLLGKLAQEPAGKIDTLAADEMKKLTGGLALPPGMKLPF